MRQMLKIIFAGPKDVIALIIVMAYALAFLLITLVPSVEFNEVIWRHYKEITLMVVGFYFGGRTGSKGTDEKEGN